MESLCQEELEDALDCAAPHSEGEVLNSLKALPDRITRMEEQWRDTLREVQRSNAHTNATMMDMRLELLTVKKAALRDDDSVRNIATEAKHLSDVQAIDLDAIQRKLSAHDDQIREVKERVEKNDEKHQRSYEKLLDTMSALNVAQERMLEMMQSDAMDEERIPQESCCAAQCPNTNCNIRPGRADQSRAPL